MPTYFKLNPNSAKASATNNIAFELDGLDPSVESRIVIENATQSHRVLVKSIGDHDNPIEHSFVKRDVATSYGEVVIVSGSEKISGIVDLRIDPHVETDVVSIFASIEQKIDGEWTLTDMAAFAFSLEFEHAVESDVRVEVNPLFVDPKSNAAIVVNAKPQEQIKVIINGKEFLIKTNYNGYGSIAFRGKDVLGHNETETSVMQRFIVSYSRQSDGFGNIYQSPAVLHIVPEGMKALQSADNFEDLECVVFDPDPPPGATIDPIEEITFCNGTSVIGDKTLFDNSSGGSFVNSLVGYASPLRQITSDDDVCRINNSLSSHVLPNGVALTAFSSQKNEEGALDPVTGRAMSAELASKVFVGVSPSSLKYRGNPLRRGIVLKPAVYYHSISVDSVDGSGQNFGILFRTADGNSFEVEYRSSANDTTATVAAGLATAVNADSRVDNYDITAVRVGSRVDVFTDSIQFTVLSQTHGDGTSEMSASLNTNNTIEVLIQDEDILEDVGNTLVFLSTNLDRRSFTIVGRESPDILRLEVPEGVNNGRGPTIEANIPCNLFVIIDGDDELELNDGDPRLVELPYYMDSLGENVSVINPVISSNKTYAVTGSEENRVERIYVYVVAQVVIDGVYQLCMFSWEWGEEDSDDFSNREWIILTEEGENKNPSVSMDSRGNMHLVWESDREGPSQIYYSCLGPSSRARNNQAVMSLYDKIVDSETYATFHFIGSPTSLQDDWFRFVSNNGKISVSGPDDVVVRANPAFDGAVAITRLSTDVDGVDFRSSFDQLSYELKFDFTIDGLDRLVKTDEELDDQFFVWKSQFDPIGSRKYLFNENIFFLDQSGRYFENIIPIAGSYDFRRITTEDNLTPIEVDDYSSLLEQSSSFEARAVPGVTNSEPGYITLEQAAKLAALPNVKHWMIGIVPEKVRFKAVNTEPLFAFCERQSLPVDDCSNYIQQIEKIVPTGRYKLAMIIATSDDESDFINQNRRFKILRLLGDFVTLSDDMSFRIGVHYARNMQDDIEQKLEDRFRSITEQDQRFTGSLYCLLDDELVFGQSFLADFSDQNRIFDIGLGVPSEGRFITNEILPFNGNQYEDALVTMTYSDIAIGQSSLFPRAPFLVFNKHDRNLRLMQEPSAGTENLISNGDFETALLNPGNRNLIAEGSGDLVDWEGSNGGFTYIGGQLHPVRGDRIVGVFTAPETGGIKQTINTTVGKEYSVQFYLAGDTTGGDIVATLKVAAGAASETFEFDTFGQRWEDLGWVRREFRFTASSSTTTIEFTNETVESSYGPIIDNIGVFEVDDMPNELSSINDYQSLLQSETDYWLTLGVDAYETISQVPITLVESRVISKNPSIVVDQFDVVHIAYQANNDKFWEIYYTSSENRSLPFRHQIRITDSESMSMNPSIAVDNHGRRLIVWQDNRDGEWQIYGATARRNSRFFQDPCEFDSGIAYTYDANQTVDPYDPYESQSFSFACDITFDFVAPVEDSYHFEIFFYSDSEFKNLVKAVKSSDSVAGWTLNSLQFPADGAAAAQDDVLTVRYEISKEDELSGRVLYVIVRYNSPIIWDASTNIIESDLRDDIDLRGGRLEDNDCVFEILEFQGTAPGDRGAQVESDFYDSRTDVTGISFPSGLASLPGYDQGDFINVHYFHFDVVGTADENNFQTTAVIKFADPIVSIIWNEGDLDTTDADFARDDVEYEEFWRGLEFLDGFEFFEISEDRKTLTANLALANVEVGLADSFRVVTKRSEDVRYDSQRFTFYCPREQKSRCDVSVSYVNETSEAQNVHFRTTAYADANKQAVVFSAFTLTSTDKWRAGFEGFPANGVSALPGKYVSAAFDPEILPFDLYDLQDVTDRTISNRLLCGVPYYIVTEAYVNGQFIEMDSFTLICPCRDTNPQLWASDFNTIEWISSAQGKDDLRITNTQSRAMRPKAIGDNSDVIYIVWEDYRYADAIASQPVLSPDYFMGVWFVEENNFVSSGQGEVDRRVTSYTASGSRTLYDIDIASDQFNNIYVAFHDGTDLFSKSISLGCSLDIVAPNELDPGALVQPCEFTDSSSFSVGGDKRDDEQYLALRLAPNSVKYSTYLDGTRPIEVVTDCFVELDIIGVPGTYAYRLKNEEDQEWSQWLPIGPDLPDQPLPEGSQFSQEEIQKEQDYFRAYFLEKERFIAPWILSPNSGTKRVQCEILTFFGKTSSFSTDIIAVYDELVYDIDFFYDEELTRPVGEYNNFPVVGDQSTPTQIVEDDLTSITEDTELTGTIWAKVMFRDLDRLEKIEEAIEEVKLYRDKVARFLSRDDTSITMSVFQQGIRDQINLALTKTSDGVYKGSFTVAKEDGIFDVDGLATVVVTVPGACTIPNPSSSLSSFEAALGTNIFISDVSIFNDMTLFRQMYSADDNRRSFGDPDYYKRNQL